MTKLKTLTGALALVLHLASPVHAQVIAVETDGDGTARLEQRAVTSDPTPADVAVTVWPGTLLQRWDGVGAAMTDSAATVIAAMPTPERAALVNRMFSPTEGGFNLVRLTIGASDFSASGAYTYEPHPGNFDLSHDLAVIVPVLRQIRAVQPGLRLIAAPWSPPAWMKASGQLDGGAIAPAAFPALADYLVRYLRQYRDWGLPIAALSPQNEPMQSRGDYPTALLPAPEEANFVHEFLAPALRRAGLSATGILGLDHNWSDMAYVRTLAGSPAAADLAGYAFHCYRGDPADMRDAQALLRPGQVTLTTECSATRGGSFAQDFRHTMTMLVMGTVLNGGSGVVVWNAALDPNGGPTIGGCDNCRGVATVDAKAAVTFDASFYGLAQVGHLVRPGARVVAARTNGADVAATAFRNPDGGLVVLVYNAGMRAHRIGLSLGARHLSYSLPGNAAVTFTNLSGG